MVVLGSQRMGSRCFRSHNFVCVTVVCEIIHRCLMAVAVGLLSPVAGGGDGDYEPARVIAILSA
jgi:hypothetical protein